MKHNKKAQPPQSKRPRTAGKEPAAKGVQPVVGELKRVAAKVASASASPESVEVPLTAGVSVAPVRVTDESQAQGAAVVAASAPTPAASEFVASGSEASATSEIATPKRGEIALPAAVETPIPVAAPVQTPAAVVAKVAAPSETKATEEANVAATPLAVTSTSAEPATEPAVLAKAPLPRRSGAEQIVRDYVPLAVGAGLIPVPGFDLAAIGGLQLKLLASLAAHYRVAFTQAQAQLIVTSLLGSVGTTVLLGGALMSLAKALPGFGTLLGVSSLPVAGGAITHAVGQLAIDHFEAGGTMENFDLDVAQRAFGRKVAEAKAALA